MSKGFSVGVKVNVRIFENSQGVQKISWSHILTSGVSQVFTRKRTFCVIFKVINFFVCSVLKGLAPISSELRISFWIVIIWQCMCNSMCTLHSTLPSAMGCILFQTRQLQTFPFIKSAELLNGNFTWIMVLGIMFVKVRVYIFQPTAITINIHRDKK